MRAFLVGSVLFAGLVTALPAFGHGGGLNACGCHFNRKTGQCHCHRPRGCGCACEPSSCQRQLEPGKEQPRPTREEKEDAQGACVAPEAARP